MAVTFDELKALFASYTGTDGTVDNAQLALWFNEAILDLAYEFGPVGVVEVQAEAGEVYEPEENWLSVVDTDLEYSIRGDGKLVFVTGGKGKLYYRRIPPVFTGTQVDAECGLPEVARYLPALFAAARYWDAQSDGSSEELVLANRWLSYYQQGKSLAKSKYELCRMEPEGWLIR